MANSQYRIPPDVYAAHRALRQWSEAARYHDHQFAAATVQNLVLDTYLARILRFVGLA